MFNSSHYKTLVFLSMTLVGLACSSTESLTDKSFSPSGQKADFIISKMPDYRQSLNALHGQGKAIVSEPQNTERVTVNFSSNRNKSLVTIKNGLGIEGGQMLTDGDSLLIYNKIDKVAKKVSIQEGSISRIDNLASLNILEMINFTVTPQEVEKVHESEELFLLQLFDGSKVYVHKQSHHVQQVVQPSSSKLPYSRIIYEAYSSINDYKLPRRITIFSADKKSKVIFLIRSLDINPELEPLTINIPDNTRVYYR